jgi:hypothetical protein
MLSHSAVSKLGSVALVAFTAWVLAVGSARADVASADAGEVLALSFGTFANLGDIALGFRSVVVVPVQSVGDAPVTIHQFSLSAARAPLAQILADGCANKVLDPGRICRVAVAFTPPKAGSFSVTLFAESDANGGDTQRVTVFNGVSSASVKALELSSYGIEFGALPLDASSTQEVVVTSVGNVAVSISAVLLAGGDNMDFAMIRDKCSGLVLASSQSCSVYVEFSPMAAGLRAAVLTIVSDVDNVSSPQAYLAGSGDTLFRNGFDPS